MEKDIIDSFFGEYRWLSNFYYADVVFDDDIYPSIENAYQAAKTYKEQRTKFQNCTPSEAKKLGRSVLIRDDWEYVKVSIMRDLIQQKFHYGSELAMKLLETDNIQLIEGNNWNDTFWGVCNNKGKNTLGKLLMEQREYLKEKRVNRD